MPQCFLGDPGPGGGDQGAVAQRRAQLLEAADGVVGVVGIDGQDRLDDLDLVAQALDEGGARRRREWPMSSWGVR